LQEDFSCSFPTGSIRRLPEHRSSVERQLTLTAFGFAQGIG
jgi:hypothetical protein